MCSYYVFLYVLLFYYVCTYVYFVVLFRVSCPVGGAIVLLCVLLGWFCLMNSTLVGGGGELGIYCYLVLSSCIVSNMGLRTSTYVSFMCRLSLLMIFLQCVQDPHTE
jgi:hypothetical protein